MDTSTAGIARHIRLVEEVARLRAALRTVKDELLNAGLQGTEEEDAEEACGIYYERITKALFIVEIALK